MHAYDALCRSKCHAAQMGHVVQMGCVAQVSGIARLVGVQRMVQNNVNVKSEPKYLAVKNLQYVLSTVELFFVLLSLYWLLRWLTSLLFFLRVTSRQLRSALVHGLGSANMYIAKVQQHCPPHPPMPRNAVLTSLCNAHI